MGIRDFIKRHRRSLLAAVGLGASAYWLYRLFEEKLQDIQERLAAARIARLELVRRSEECRLEAAGAFNALFPEISAKVRAKFDVENTRAELQALRSIPPTETPPVTKAELWNRIKVQSLARFLTEVYIHSLLTLFVRVQLSFVGRASLSAGIRQILGRSVDENEVNGNEEEAIAGYLAMSWWLLNRGWLIVASASETAVHTVFSKIEPTAVIASTEFEQLVARAHAHIDDLVLPQLVAVLLPPPELVSDTSSRVTGFPASSEVTNLVMETGNCLLACQQLVEQLVNRDLEIFSSRVRSVLAPNQPENSEIKVAQILLFSAKEFTELSANLDKSPYKDLLNQSFLDEVCADVLLGSAN